MGTVQLYYEEYDLVSDFYRRLANGIPISIHAQYMQEEYSSMIAVQMVNVFILHLKECDIHDAQVMDCSLPMIGIIL